MDAAPAIVTRCLRLRRSPGSVRRSAAPASQYLFPGCPWGSCVGSQARGQERKLLLCAALCSRKAAALPIPTAPQVQNVVGQKLKARTH